MKYGMRPRARVLWRGYVDNRSLVDLVSQVARNSVNAVRWPATLDPNAAPSMAYEYVRDHTTYYPDRGDQYIRTPRAFVREGIGDCKTSAVFIASLAHAAGHDAQLKFITLPGKSHFGHVYAVVNGVPHDPLLQLGEEVLHSQAHIVNMDAYVLNGIPAARGTALVNAAQPTTVGEMYHDALCVLDGINGADWAYYSELAKRSNGIVEIVERNFPGVSWEELYSIPVNGIGNIWQDLHKATTNVSREWDWLPEAQRINPLLVPVRAAIIELTKANIGGLADLFRTARPEVLKAQWEANGGKWHDFEKAIATGHGRKGDSLPPQSVNGFHPSELQFWWDAYGGIGDPVLNQYTGGTYPPPNNPAFNAPPTQPPGSTPPIAQSGGTWNSLWNVAGPLLNNLLGAATSAAGDRITQAINPTRPAPTPTPTRPPLRAPQNRSLVVTNVRRPKPKKEIPWGLIGGAAALLVATGTIKLGNNS